LYGIVKGIGVSARGRNRENALQGPAGPMETNEEELEMSTRMDTGQERIEREE
jgi:hypothetical protein